MINPRVDLAFKKIFGVEENKDLLISLINSIVSEPDQVADIILLNPYNPRNFKNDKLSILDIKAQGKDGKRFNIEIQITDEASYDKRALYYWAKLYTEQLSKSDNYCQLSKTIGIHILNFTSIVGVNKYHNTFHITEKETGEPYFTDLELHTIELKKFNDDVSNDLTSFISRITTSLDLWVAFLTRHELLNNAILPKAINDSALKKALEVIEEMNFTSEERECYEGQLKWLRIEASALLKAEEKAETRGIEIGKEQGIEIGKEQGIEIGKEQGIEIGGVLASTQIAIKLLAKNFDCQMIAEATGLSLDEIKALQKTVMSLNRQPEPA